MRRKKKKTLQAPQPMEGEEEGAGLEPAETLPPPPINPDSESFTPMVTPVILEVSTDLGELIDPSLDGGRFMLELIPKMRKDLFAELGLRSPGIRVRRIPSLPPKTYVIAINEVPLISGQVMIDHVLVQESAERLKLLGIKGEVPSENPETRRAACWIPTSFAETMRAVGYSVWDIPECLILHLRAAIKRYASEFVGVQEVQFLLDSLDLVCPDLVKETIPGRVDIVRLTEILKRLVDEGVSIRDMQGILQAIAENAQHETNSVMLTERVRVALRRSIASKHARGGTALLVFLLDSEIERIIQASIQHTGSGMPYLSITSDLAQKIIGAVRREYDTLKPSTQRPVILTKIQLRYHLYALLAHEFKLPPPVMSYQELPPEIEVKPFAQIMLNDPAPAASDKAPASDEAPAANETQAS
jgi:type III secretion protein V